MVDETRKSLNRRQKDLRFGDRYIIGNGVDIGAGNDGLSKYPQLFPKMLSCYDWDLKDGDAELMESVQDNYYDFVHSSHCLEHMKNPITALSNWIRITKPGGHLIILIPDEDLYEQGVFPSTFNDDHKATFTIDKSWIYSPAPEGADPFVKHTSQRVNSWSPRSYNVTNMLQVFTHSIQILKIELLDATFDYYQPRLDQTLGVSESAIEIILRKKTEEEIQQKGRLPRKHMFLYKR